MANKTGPGPNPARAIYGFVLYLVGFACGGLYLVWAYTPPHILASVGLTYWPQRYWAVAVPIYLSISVTLFFVILAGVSLLQVPPSSSIYTIQDTADIIVYKPVTLKPQQIPPIRDIPIDKHCQDMYLLRYPDIVGHTATSY